MFPVTDHSTFSLRWVHSVEQEEWEEFFRITDHSIYVDSTRFKTFGAGVPNQAGKASYLKNGWLYMVGIDRKIDDLHVRAGSTTNHRLYMKGKVYTLSVEDEQKPYHFMIENIPIYRYLTHLLLTKFQR